MNPTPYDEDTPFIEYAPARQPAEEMLETPPLAAETLSPVTETPLDSPGAPTNVPAAIAQPASRRPTILLLTLTLLILLLASGGLVSYQATMVSRQEYVQATATTRAASAQATTTAQAIFAQGTTIAATATAQSQIAATDPADSLLYDQITSRPPSIIDPLNREQGSHWHSSGDQQGSCGFTNGAYHIRLSQINHFLLCQDDLGYLSNFALQVTMTLVQGGQADGAGIFFRVPGNSLAELSAGYVFDVDAYGSYILGSSYPLPSGQMLAHGSGGALNTGLNQTNVLTIIAQGASIHIYINKRPVGKASDKIFSTGELGLYVFDLYEPVDVAFSNIQIWKL